jgi:hypothetical protein
MTIPTAILVIAFDKNKLLAPNASIAIVCNFMMSISTFISTLNHLMHGVLSLIKQ